MIPFPKKKKKKKKKNTRNFFGPSQHQLRATLFLLGPNSRASSFRTLCFAQLASNHTHDVRRDKSRLQVSLNAKSREIQFLSDKGERVVMQVDDLLSLIKANKNREGVKLKFVWNNKDENSIKLFFRVRFVAKKKKKTKYRNFFRSICCGLKNPFVTARIVDLLVKLFFFFFFSTSLSSDCVFVLPNKKKKKKKKKKKTPIFWELLL